MFPLGLGTRRRYSRSMARYQGYKGVKGALVSRIEVKLVGARGGVAGGRELICKGGWSMRVTLGLNVRI